MGVIFVALIKCEECGQEVSDQAFACPKCGYPIKKIEEVPPILSENVKQTITIIKEKGFWSTGRLTIGVVSILLFVLIMIQSCAAGALNIMTANGSNSGMQGAITAICFLTAGTIGLCTRNSLSSIGPIITVIFYWIGTIMTLNTTGVYADLPIWGNISFAFGLFFLVCAINASKEDKSSEGHESLNYPKIIISTVAVIISILLLVLLNYAIAWQQASSENLENSMVSDNKVDASIESSDSIQDKIQNMYFIDLNWDTPEYAPSLVLFPDGSFTLVDNLYNDMQFYYGKYTIEGEDKINLNEEQYGLCFEVQKVQGGLKFVSGTEEFVGILNTEPVFTETSEESYYALAYNSENYLNGFDDAAFCINQYWEDGDYNLDEYNMDMQVSENGVSVTIYHNVTNEEFAYYLVDKNNIIYDANTMEFLYQAVFP